MARSCDSRPIFGAKRCDDEKGDDSSDVVGAWVWVVSGALEADENVPQLRNRAKGEEDVGDEE